MLSWIFSGGLRTYLSISGLLVPPTYLEVAMNDGWVQIGQSVGDADADVKHLHARVSVVGTDS